MFRFSVSIGHVSVILSRSTLDLQRIRFKDSHLVVSSFLLLFVLLSLLFSGRALILLFKLIKI